MRTSHCFMQNVTYIIQLKSVNRDSFKGDFLLVDMMFWEHFLYNAM